MGTMGTRSMKLTLSWYSVTITGTDIDPGVFLT